MQKMIGKMVKMYPMLIAMGFMIVAASFVIGFLNSQTAAAYFSAGKITRETTLMSTRAAFASVDHWLPYLKFLGLGLILGGIVMALRVIIDNLKAAGLEVLSNLPPEKRTPMPEAPWYGKMMPMVMMVGMLIFIVAFVVALGSAGAASAVFANPVPVIDAAGSGSVLLAQVQGIHATDAWLTPFKFFGVATEFLAIVMGLGTIIFILNAQIKLLDNAINIGRESGVIEVSSVQAADQVPAK